MLRPPSLAGRSNMAHSRSLGGGCPVRAGNRSDLNDSSNGRSRFDMFGCTRLRNVHLLDIPWVRAEKAACGCVLAILLRVDKFCIHYCTFDLT